MSQNMSKETILIVEDEADIQELIRYNLKREGYSVESADTGEKALELARQKTVDLILLDLMLPAIDGLEVCKLLKNNESTASIPIIMLTAKGEEADIVTGLELGADDYIPKPFSPRVLIARLRAVLRRRTVQPPEEGDTLNMHGITVHPGRHEVQVDGVGVELTNTEFRVLHYLMRRPGWVFTRYQIVDAVHGTDYAVTDRSVDVQIVGLRKKLGDAGQFVETVRGVGYRFKE